MTQGPHPDIIDPTMTTEIRPISEDDLEAAHFLLAYSFTGDRSEEGRLKHVESMGTALALYDEGQMAACLRIFPLQTFIHGASIPLGGISGVACLPEHRRKGYVGRLLRHALALMREQGQPLSSLYTPHSSLYRRYGWMTASNAVSYRFTPKEIAPVSAVRPEGHSYRITDKEWPKIADVYKRFAAHRNGYLDRDERWWKEATFRRIYDSKRKLSDVAVWANGQGQPSGYLVYHSDSQQPPDAPSIDKIYVEELIALDTDAYSGLLRYLLAHDVASRVTWFGTVDEPLSLLVEEPDRIKREIMDGFMLRLVDLEKAFAVRPAAPTAPEGAFTVHISDPSAPWNQGLWRIESSGGQLTATRADGTADLSADASAFAAMYNGFLRPTEAARTGLAEVSDPQAAALADRILAADYPPHPSDFF